MQQLKAFASVLPGLAVPTVAKWQNLFIRTRLANPDWASGAQEISLAIGAFLAVVLCVIHASETQAQIRSAATRLLIATLAGFVCCFIFYVVLGQPFANMYSALLNDLWFGCFIATMTVMIGTVAELSLITSKARHPIVFWLIAGIAFVVLVVALIVWLVF